MAKRSADGLFKRGAIWWGWRRKSPGAALTRASTGCRDRAAARLVKAEWERQSADPVRWAANKTTLREALDAYMLAQRQAKLSPHTLESYDLHCRQLARTLDQDTLLKDIGHHSFLAHIKAREGEGTHPHTVARELVRLMGVLVEAKRAGRYAHDLTGMKPRYSRAYTPRERALPMDEFLRLGRELRADRLAHVAFVVATGCRLKESLRAKPGHILPEGFVYLDGTKTKRAKRTIPIAPPLRAFLEFALRNAPGKDAASPVTSLPSGARSQSEGATGGLDRLPVAGTATPALFPPWTNSRRDILAACKRAGIAPCTWNDLRRTNATLLSEAGVGGELGGRLLGHTDARMWEAVYAKPRPVALARQLEAIFEGAEQITVVPRAPKGDDDEDEGGAGAAGRGARVGGVRPLGLCGEDVDHRGGPDDAGLLPTGLVDGGRDPSSVPRVRAQATGEPVTHSTLAAHVTVGALAFYGQIAAELTWTDSLRSRRSQDRSLPGAPAVSKHSAELDELVCPPDTPQLAGVRLTSSTVGSPRLCPGCRSLDGEHDLGPTCTVAAEWAALDPHHCYRCGLSRAAGPCRCSFGGTLKTSKAEQGGRAYTRSDVPVRRKPGAKRAAEQSAAVPRHELREGLVGSAPKPGGTSASPGPAAFHVWPAIGVTPEEIAADLAPSINEKIGASSTTGASACLQCGASWARHGYACNLSACVKVDKARAAKVGS